MKLFIAQKQQLSIIRDLAYQIWPNTYGATHTDDELDYMLTKFYAIESLENQWSNGHIFIIVADNEKNFGFASYEINAENTGKTKIHKLYVLPEIQGKGIGTTLVDYIKYQALIHNNAALFLNVNKLNKAKHFYNYYGFSITKDTIIDIGNGFVMDDYVMELNL